MFERILFPTDGSEGASEALDHVLAVAAEHDATVHLLYVADSTEVSTSRIRGEVIDALEEEGERVVAEAAERAQTHRVSTWTQVVQGEPYHAITEYAEVRDIDLIAMASHGRRGLERIFVGSTTERVLRRASVPVLVLPMEADAETTYPSRDVLVPTDGSEAAEAALSLGVEVTQVGGGALHLLTVIDADLFGARGSGAEGFRKEAESILEEAGREARAAGIESVAETAEEGRSIYETILEYIDEHEVDLVTVGTHGRTGVQRHLLGSVTEYLIRTSPIPVLVTRSE